MEEKVSIIMPAYNAEKYITDSINSVLKQTYENWELIIVNDCSVDTTYQICKDFSINDSRIKIISLDKNQGISNARNKGLQECQGKFIAFLDSDDLWKEDKLDEQLKFMKQNNAAFVFTGYELIDEYGQTLNKIINVPEEVSFKDLLKVNSVGCLTVIIDRTLVSEFEMPSIKHEDYATWLSILKDNSIKALGLNKNLAYYRKSNNSVSSNKLKTLKWTWTIYHKHVGCGKLKSSLYLLRFIKNTVIKYS